MRYLTQNYINRLDKITDVVSIYEKLPEIYNVITQYYTEERVDIQNKSNDDIVDNFTELINKLSNITNLNDNTYEFLSNILNTEITLHPDIDYFISRICDEFTYHHYFLILFIIKDLNKNTLGFYILKDWIAAQQYEKPKNFKKLLKLHKIFHKNFPNPVLEYYLYYCRKISTYTNIAYVVLSFDTNFHKRVHVTRDEYYRFILNIPLYLNNIFKKYDLLSDIVLIHFPEITIVNTSNTKLRYDLKDIYIQLTISITNGALKQMKLIRSTVSDVESLKYYQHSHCNESPFLFGSLCLGGGPISLTKLKISTPYPSVFLYKVFCYELFEYLQVESSVGGPYKTIRSLLNVIESSEKSLQKIEDLNYLNLKPILGRFSRISETHIASLKKVILVNLDKFQYKYSNNKLLLNENLLDFIRKINKLLNKSSIYIPTRTVMLDIDTSTIYITDNRDNNTYYRNELRNTLNHIPRNLFTFKNKIVQSKVVESKNIIDLEYEELSILNPIYYLITYNFILLTINKLITTPKL